MSAITPFLAQIWRHPIKAHGAERLDTVSLIEGETMPWDRTWAVPHEAAQTDGGSWVSCRNFTRGAGYPSLMALDAHFNAETKTIQLSHPKLSEFSFCPDDNPEAFLQWIKPILPANRPSPTGIIRSTSQGMTDQSKPWISILNLASLHSLGEKLGLTLDPRRFRGNLWIDGLAEWDERNWVGRNLTIGNVKLVVKDHIERCRATEVDPESGERDANTLSALSENWGHRDFGVFAQVTVGGSLSVGDKFEVST